jgi:hypothetical protein
MGDSRPIHYRTSSGFKKQAIRAWVKTFDPNHRGHPLRHAQTIEKAMWDIMKNPGAGLAIPMIPGKAPREISYKEGIEIIGAQFGVIAVRKPSFLDGAIEFVLVVDEKLRLLEEASETTPELYKQVLGIDDEQEFHSIVSNLRRNRNMFAHPDPSIIRGKNLDYTLFPKEYTDIVQRIVAWDPSPYTGKLESTIPVFPMQ